LKENQQRIKKPRYPAICLMEDEDCIPIEDGDSDSEKNRDVVDSFNVFNHFFFFLKKKKLAITIYSKNNGPKPTGYSSSLCE
jgi:hypothetical protein